MNATVSRTHTATYSPDDNKLRLYPAARLDAETYARVKAAGFGWAPKQELFVAPMWTPGREDLLLDLAGEIGDEDTSLTERAEQRANRFEQYSENRLGDANGARAAVAAIADGIPLGQPILVGHHSERHARKDAERIENGMRRAVRMWETSKYWTSRAAGAIRAAKYKERPGVRARRIKGLEADARKQERAKAHAQRFVGIWTKRGLTLEEARTIANHDWINLPPTPEKPYGTTLYSALADNVLTAEQAREVAVRAHQAVIATCDRWLAHIGNRLEYERAMVAESGGTAADKTGPEVGGACKCWAGPRGGWSHIVKVNKVSVSVLDNWGNGGGNFKRTVPFDKLAAVMTRAEVEEKRAAGLLVETQDKTGFHLLDAPPPVPRTSQPAGDQPAFEAMRDAVKAGVKVVAVPDLFPTPADLAARMVELAEIEAGQRVLEPSAGTGRLVDALDAVPDVTVVAVEVSNTLSDNLRIRSQTRTDVRCADFLLSDGDLGQFDRIVMNPPFGRGQDIAHIKHALTMLAPGGRLVALCANGPRQSEQLEPLADSWEVLPPGTFKESGTDVSVVLLTMSR
jgi:protein-L-isoaspartate O-methyltransferase